MLSKEHESKGKFTFHLFKRASLAENVEFCFAPLSVGTTITMVPRVTQPNELASHFSSLDVGYFYSND